MNCRKLIGAATGILLTAFGAFSSFIEPARLVVNRQDLSIPKWPVELAGLRVALLSDLHVGSPHWGVLHTRELIARVNAEHADLVLLAGDYMSDGVKFGRSVAPEAVAAELGELRAPLGVVAVLGNHDGWHGAALRRFLEARGIAVLDDEVVQIETRGATFCVLGLADQFVRKRSPREELELAPAGLPLLVLVHEPDVFAELDDRPSLTLAGHTHGGQVKLPIIGAPITHSKYGQRYRAGHIVEGGRHLFVTTGVGTSTWPIRFGVPPEYVILTVRGNQPQNAPQLPPR